MKCFLQGLLILLLGAAAYGAPVPATLSVDAAPGASPALAALAAPLRDALLERLPADALDLSFPASPRLDARVSLLSFRRLVSRRTLSSASLDVLRLHLLLTAPGAPSPLHDGDLLFPASAPAAPESLLLPAAQGIADRILAALPSLPGDSDPSTKTARPPETHPRQEPLP